MQDRNYIQFLVNDTRVLDTLGKNAAQLGKIQARMAELIAQQEFYVDSVVLTASASPEGRFNRNRTLAQGRAHALKGYLQERIGPQVDTLVRVRWVAEDWPELAARIRGDESLPQRAEILELIAAEKDPDRREQVIREVSEHQRKRISVASGRDNAIRPATQGDDPRHYSHPRGRYSLHAGCRPAAKAQVRESPLQPA